MLIFRQMKPGGNMTEKTHPTNAAMQLFGYIPEPKNISNPALQNGRLGVSLPLTSGVPDVPSKGLLKVVGYVHNRITFCSYPGGSKLVAKRMKANMLKQICNRSGNFNLLPETRRGLKVGNRTRFECLETDWTSRAKAWVRDAGELIETEAGGLPLFLTLTCPGNTEEIFRAFGIASGYIADRLNRWLRYKVDKGWFAYVWEVQERGAPHLHYMFRMDRRTNFASFYKETRCEWRKILLDVSKECGIDLFNDGEGGTHAGNPNLPVINFKVIKTKVAGYLAKYASKERSKGLRNISFVPGRWWGISYSVRRECLLRRVSYVLGFTTIEHATERLVAAVEKIGSVAIETWRPKREKTGPCEYVSVTIGGVSAADCANALRDWFIGGDLTALEFLGVSPYMVAPTPA